MTGSTGGARYAIYFAPDSNSALAMFGRDWLGLDPATGVTRPQPAIDGLTPDRLAEITASARHYGFHATLKAPFALAPGTDLASLKAALSAFADERRAFQAPPLTLGDLDGFLALVLSAPCPDMDRLHSDCVAHFDRFRAPPTKAELDKRRGGGLTLYQESMLDRWGYPYVMEDFRFHMTLTARLAEPERTLLRAALTERSAAVTADPLPVTAICLFAQPGRDRPFGEIARYPLSV